MVVLTVLSFSVLPHKVLKYSEYEWIELKKQLDMDFQARLLAKERDFDREKKKLNSEVKELKAANEKLKTSFTDMQKIVTEYEKTISQVICKCTGKTSRECSRHHCAAPRQAELFARQGSPPPLIRSFP